jgi:uncharacterized protein
MTNEFTITPRTQVRRMKERASYDRARIIKIIDETLIGTIAFNDGTNVHAIPMAVWRVGDYLYIHGSNGSRLLKFLQTGTQACVTITHLHGLVLARSAFHHSINYCSVCIYGSFEVVAESEKEQHMQRFLEHWMPGRWQHVRTPNKNELGATTFMRISITEAVLKSRQGPPKDDEADMQQRVWAGVMPFRLEWQEPQQVADQNDPH